VLKNGVTVSSSCRCAVRCGIVLLVPIVPTPTPTYWLNLLTHLPTYEAACVAGVRNLFMACTLVSGKGSFVQLPCPRSRR
jgi:hypothetical protein